MVRDAHVLKSRCSAPRPYASDAGRGGVPRGRPIIARMREKFREDVRQIAGAIAFETVMRYSDALARSPHAEQTMEATSRRVATEVARAIADERVAHAGEIVQAAKVMAGNTATETAQEVAKKTATSLGAETTAQALEEARAAVEEELKDAWEALE